MQPIIITITTILDVWRHFVNGVHGDAGVVPSDEALIESWVNENTDRHDSIDPTDWTLPDPKDAPSVEDLTATWKARRDERATRHMITLMKATGRENAVAHARRAADAQIYAAVDAAERGADQATTVTVK
jgi:hypothetical protein